MANSDTNTQPWHADRIVGIPFLVEKLGDESRGRDLSNLPALAPAASAYETSRLKTAGCGSGHIRRSRRTIGPLVCQDEQNRHTFLRVIPHDDR